MSNLQSSIQKFVCLDQLRLVDFQDVEQVSRLKIGPNVDLCHLPAASKGAQAAFTYKGPRRQEIDSPILFYSKDQTAKC